MTTQNCCCQKQNDTMTFRRGNTYELPAWLAIGPGFLGVEYISEVEFQLGPIRKMYPTDVAWDNDHFVIPLTQQDTFRLGYKSIPCQVRVLFINGRTKSTNIEYAPIYDSVSKEVLQ